MRLRPDIQEALSRAAVLLTAAGETPQYVAMHPDDMRVLIGREPPAEWYDADGVCWVGGKMPAAK